MSEAKVPRRLWSDFDGTAVSIVRKTNPRNWSKYPLPIIEGYLDFLKGAQDSGIEVAGIVSRRPDILPRRLVTARSVAQLGMSQFFPAEKHIVLTGSEYAKAGFVAKDAMLFGRVGMIDDKPHKFGAAFAEYMLSDDIRHAATLVLGAVHTPSREEHLEKLAAWATNVNGVEVTSGTQDLYIGHHEGRFGIRVIPLEPYSETSGQAFGQALTEPTLHVK